VVAIASGGAREEGKVAIAGGVNIRLAFNVMVAIVIVIRHLADEPAVALITIMTDSCVNFRRFLVEGTKPNLKKIKEYVDRSLMLR
jgi:fumarate hydratase class II